MTSAPACSRCRWVGAEDAGLFCANPKMVDAGRSAPGLDKLDTTRADAGLCGPGAQWFERDDGVTS